MDGVEPDAMAQFRPAATYKTQHERECDALHELLAVSGPEWCSGGSMFEKARGIVARKLGWDAEEVMDWEVRSYLWLDRPAWATNAGLDLGKVRAPGSPL